MRRFRNDNVLVFAFAVERVSSPLCLEGSCVSTSLSSSSTISLVHVYVELITDVRLRVCVGTQHHDILPKCSVKCVEHAIITPLKMEYLQNLSLLFDVDAHCYTYISPRAHWGRAPYRQLIVTIAYCSTTSKSFNMLNMVFVCMDERAVMTPTTTVKNNNLWHFYIFMSSVLRCVCVALSHSKM